MRPFHSSRPNRRHGNRPDVGYTVVQCQSEGKGEDAGDGGDDECLQEEVGESVGDDSATVGDGV